MRDLILTAILLTFTLTCGKAHAEGKQKSSPVHYLQNPIRIVTSIVGYDILDNGEILVTAMKDAYSKVFYFVLSEAYTDEIVNAQFGDNIVVLCKARWKSKDPSDLVFVDCTGANGTNKVPNNGL
jgi:hypothetical protein